jgi:hypothetical protein
MKTAFLLCCVVAIAIFGYIVVDEYMSNRTVSLTGQVTALSMENAELRRQLVAKNNERLLYEAAQKDNDTVNLIAQWHVFQPVLLLLGGICLAVFLPLIWMGWTYALRYYLSAVRKFDE